MTDTANPILTKLADLAPAVARQHAEMTSAFEGQRDAEAAVLARVVDLVRPALRALSSRLKGNERTWWPDSVSTATEKSYHDERGVIVDGNGPTRDHPRANDGEIEGCDLVLLEDGTFARLDWSGTWTRWQGRTSEQTSELTKLTLHEVVADWNLEEISRTLVERLEAQLAGRATKTTQAARDRAEKLRAVAALM